MVPLTVMQESNGRLSHLSKPLVVLFIGATSGIGQSALQHFAKSAPSAHVYSVARPASAAAHEKLLDTLRTINPGSMYNAVIADISLVAEVDRVVNHISKRETKLDILFMSAGFMAFEGRKDTSEGLDPSMSTRYYSRVRAVQRLLPLLNSPAAASPRVVSVLAGGVEGPLNEEDLDLQNPKNWSFWNASVHSTTMGTLALEVSARQNQRLSIVHWYPGPVATPGLARANKYGMHPTNPISQDEAGIRALFIATSDRYAVIPGLIPLSPQVKPAKRSDGGIFLIDPLGESTDNEQGLARMRNTGLSERVWNFTQEIFKRVNTI